MVDDDFFVFVDFFIFCVSCNLYSQDELSRFCCLKSCEENYSLDKIWENYELKFNKKSCIYLYACGYKDVETRERILYPFSEFVK